jgi:hypothetical protein
MSTQNNLRKYAFTGGTAAASIAMPFAFAGAVQAQETQAVVVQPEPVNNNDMVAVAAPWLLAGMAVAVPLLWLLMRLTPPQPVQVRFPGTRLLKDLQPQQETPASLPLWHKLLRIGAAVLATIGLAGLMLNPDAPIKGEGPLVLVVDNGWAAARGWDARLQEIGKLIDSADSQERNVILLPTAQPRDGSQVRATPLMTADEARDVVKTWQPVPWPEDRAAALKALEVQAETLKGPASAVWLSNGIGGDGAEELAARLHAMGTLTVREDAPGEGAHLLVPPAAQEGVLSVTVRRAVTGEEEVVGIAATDRNARVVDRQEAKFAAGDTEVKVTFSLPDEIQKQMVRLDIEGENTAAATVLLDGQWRHRPVGLVMGGSGESLQPLLSEFNYIEKALKPYAELRQGTVDALLKRDLAVMILADSAVLDEATRTKIDEWVRAGGTVLRFAGPRLAQTEDILLPVDLRDDGARTLGGVMSWSKPAKIAPFPKNSPFNGLKLPPDVVIETQVLAEPSAELDERTWARLEDGTPLVTAEKRGQGQIVLIHTSANTNWSNLALSGLFIDMMRAVVERSEGVRGTPDGNTTLPPWKTMDAQGRLENPGSAVRGLTEEAVRAGLVGPQNPPGIYGGESGRRAHNLGAAPVTIEKLGDLPAGTDRAVYVEGKQSDLTGPLLGGALLLILADMLVVLGSRRFRGLRQNPESKAAPAAPAPQ